MRPSSWPVLAILLVYSVGFFLWYPPGLGVRDELAYLRQAVTFSRGETRMSRLDLLDGKVLELPPAEKPPGTALLMAPAVRLGGWRAAYLVPLIFLWVAVLATAALLRQRRLNPAWALAVLVYPPMLVLGRAAMSDVLAAAWSAVGLLLFHQGIGRSGRRCFAAGLVAGSSVLIREATVLTFTPFFAGALLRRERGALPLAVGSVMGAALRFPVAMALFGDPLHTNRHFLSYGFGLDLLPANLLQYTLALSILVPGGLVAVALYRGQRRAELWSAFALTVLFYSLYRYSGGETGGLKRLIITPRFLTPLLPLVALALADVAPRFGRAIGRRLPPLAPHRRLVRWGLLLPAAAAALAVHPVHASWTRERAAVGDRIRARIPSSACIMGSKATVYKYLGDLDGSLRAVTVEHQEEALAALPRLAGRCPDLRLVVVDRFDSEYWRAWARRNEEMVVALGRLCRLEAGLDDRLASGDLHLRTWRLYCGGSGRRSLPER